MSWAWAKQDSEAWDIFHRKMEAVTAGSLNGLHGSGGEFERVCEGHQHLFSCFGTLYLLSQLPGWLSGKELWPMREMPEMWV